MRYDVDRMSVPQDTKVQHFIRQCSMYGPHESRAAFDRLAIAMYHDVSGLESRLVRDTFRNESDDSRSRIGLLDADANRDAGER